MSDRTVVSQPNTEAHILTNIDDDRQSLGSMRTVSSRGSSTSAVARREAMVALATAKASQQYELLIQEKQREQHDTEHERELREHDIELERNKKHYDLKVECQRKQQETERQLSMLAASRAVAIAEATLKAIDQYISDEEANLDFVEEQNSKNRTSTWIRQQSGHSNDVRVSVNIVPDLPTAQTDIDRLEDASSAFSVKIMDVAAVGRAPHEADGVRIYEHVDVQQVHHSQDCHDNGDIGDIVPSHGHIADTRMPASPTSQAPQPIMTNAQHMQRYTTNKTHDPCMCLMATEDASECPRTNTATAKQPYCRATDTTTIDQPMTQATLQSLVASLARQSLPKYEPDIFDGDVTLYYPWKNTFKSMLTGAEVSPTQELIYMRNFTTNEPQRLVDNFRRRLYLDPSNALHDAWAALDEEFGNTAAISQAYIEQIDKAAQLGESDHEKLKDFANICADIQSQLVHLPGLGSLNYANVLQPITNKMPQSIQLKWEKVVVKYANNHHDAYPGFDSFANLITSESKLRNHPNIQIGKNPSTGEETGDRHDANEDDSQALMTKTRTPKLNSKYCVWHKSPGHHVTDCDDFAEASLNEKYNFVLDTHLCFLCLDSGHISADCATNITCDICGTNDHRTDFHPSYNTVSDTHGTNVRSAYTHIQDGQGERCSCSKAVLVEVYSVDQPTISRRVYALFDDQSNASMISSELANELGLMGARERYTISTCTTDSETHYGRRISGLIARSVVNGKSTAFPSLLECHSMPNTTAEIATPEIACQYSHLRGIAKEIPDKDNTAQVMIIVGRDAPELLKVRGFRNGPRGAPWAQKLSLGWTISGQVHPDRAGRMAHITAHKTNIATETHIDKIGVDRQSKPLAFKTTPPVMTYARRKQIRWQQHGTAYVPQRSGHVPYTSLSRDA